MDNMLLFGIICLLVGFFFGLIVFAFFEQPKKFKPTKSNPSTIADEAPKPTLPKRNPYWPCILTKEQTKGMSERECLKIYEPALPYPNANIALADPKSIKFPTTEEEKEALKQGLKYVWCDGYESAAWQERECKYLGIRITDSFILHETIIRNTWSDCVRLWKEKCQARYLLWEEIMLLNYVWAKVSMMRETAHDTPLYTYSGYWYDCEARNERYRHMNRMGETFHRSTEQEACLMLAVM